MSPPRATPLRRRGPVESDDLESSAWSAALALLARRELSEQQVRDGLLRKGFPGQPVERVLERLRRQRYVDDPGLAARYAHSRLAHHGQGRHRVRQGLRKRGLPQAIIEAGLSEALAEVSEGEALERLARRYWSQKRRQPPPRRLRGLWAMLVRRGYPASLVHERLRAMWPRWSDALEGLEPADLEER